MYMVKEFLESLVSEQTRRSYKRGLAKFEEYYGKSAKFLLKEKDSGKTIERFYVWLRKKYSQNSCRALVNPIIQYCKYNNIEPRIKKSLHMYRTTLTTRDHILTAEEARAMYNVGSLEEKVIAKTWLLGLRIGDASRLEWKQFDIRPSEELKEILVNTRKEEVVAHCFIDQELQRLLAKHIPNLDQDNKYLFQSGNQDHLSEKQLLRKLQSLQKRAQVKARGRFGWHIARKLFMRTCAENGVTSWNAKLMVGKAVDKSIATYINGVSLRKDARKILNVLRMEAPKTNGRMSTITEALDLVLRVLRKMALKEIEKEQQASGYLGVMVDYSKLSHKEVLEEYLKLRKKE